LRLDHPALPPAVSRPWVLLAALVWVGAALISRTVIPIPLEPGWVKTEGVVISDVRDGPYGRWVLVETADVHLLLELDDEEISVGEGVVFEGMADGRPGRAAGRHYRSAVDVAHLEVVAGTQSIPLRIGNTVRDRVLQRLRPLGGGRALLAGFLIGDTDHLTESDMVAMRRSGLAHFVAVSGSNVALFLALVAVVAGPLAAGPKGRAMVGLAALPVYAAATRFEPSVMRASAMAALALGSRLFGVVFETWQLLALAIVVLLVAEPSLATSLGFQLSVAATAGVVMGARWPLPRSRVARSFAVTLGAQIAVAPLLLAAFGSVPLFSPLANLLAAPLVAASTVIGAIGVAGPAFLVDIGAGLADVVLWLARGAAIWPQLEPWPALGAGVLLWVGVRFRRARTFLAVAGALLMVAVVLGIGKELPDPGAVVLDVGQGDAILIHGGEGRFALVDGGPDASVLVDGLRRYGVANLELVVVTHVHADHVTGLADLSGTVPIGQVWAALQPHRTEASDRLLEGASRFGIPLVVPQVGKQYLLGKLRLVVEGPLRRYASPNDQSLVVMVVGPTGSMLLSGDIEVVVQVELSHLRADVLKVPHQGAATSDPVWLENVGASLAVISVGPNQFGHPAPWVIETLEQSGARVLRTDEHGDVVVPLG
jgi:competence protein ComEC